MFIYSGLRMLSQVCEACITTNMRPSMKVEIFCRDWATGVIPELRTLPVLYQKNIWTQSSVIKRSFGFCCKESSIQRVYAPSAVCSTCFLTVSSSLFAILPAFYFHTLRPAASELLPCPIFAAVHVGHVVVLSILAFIFCGRFLPFAHRGLSGGGKPCFCVGCLHAAFIQFWTNSAPALKDVQLLVVNQDSS
ncbi:uncharacterized protein LOC141934623 isoform X2 [Strix aluco]|uniref:uncharacterized protein LOC141934623 isoform X2 n=1 Tax=Strix aluco TaxID=111821 RepID=UPI003DA36FF6